MSYDLVVYGQRPLSEAELVELLAGAGLVVDPASSGTAALSVLRGTRSSYSFTVGLPVPVEPEDVPDEVTAVLLGASVMYELAVEGSSRREIPHAVRCARRLAQACGGAVLDQQDDGVWARGAGRAVPAVRRGIVDVVEIHWYVTSPGAGATAAVAWLDLARRFLPEALPRRFGSYEPLPLKLDRHGPTRFVDEVAAERAMIFTKASRPCIEASLAGGASDHAVQSHTLTLHREALDDPRWCHAVQRFFVEFAVATGAVFACAEVRRGLEWSGRGLAVGFDAERTIYLAGMGQWMGLPPYPTWWSWYGPDYLPLVETHLGAEARPVGAGLLHVTGERPLDRDGLLRSGLSLPSRLLASIATDDPRLYNPPLRPATVMPERLRRPPVDGSGNGDVRSDLD